MKFKICGLNNISTIECCEKNEVDYFGMIFYDKSPRYISLLESEKLVQYSINKKIEPVGVFVNESIEKIVHIIKKLELRNVQLHGNEGNDFISSIKKLTNVKIFKAISIRSKKDLEKIEKFKNVDFFLLDYKPEINELPGGNAKQFDWNLIKNLKMEKPWFISGGINEENIDKIKDFADPDGIDLSSGVEESPGIKNNNMISSLFKKYNA